jgi:hypothetical protein
VVHIYYLFDNVLNLLGFIHFEGGPGSGPFGVLRGPKGILGGPWGSAGIFWKFFGNCSLGIFMGALTAAKRSTLYLFYILFFRVSDILIVYENLKRVIFKLSG